MAWVGMFSSNDTHVDLTDCAMGVQPLLSYESNVQEWNEMEWKCDVAGGGRRIDSGHENVRAAVSHQQASPAIPLI